MVIEDSNWDLKIVLGKVQWGNMLDTREGALLSMRKESLKWRPELKKKELKEEEGGEYKDVNKRKAWQDLQTLSDGRVKAQRNIELLSK